MNPVAHEVCEQCGFDGSRYDDESVMAALRQLGPRWRRLLANSGASARVRPDPAVWSALEYAAHSRDITSLHCFGVEQALTEVEPVYPAIDGDNLIETASAGYEDEDVDAVLRALDAHARRLADLGEAASAEEWERGLTIGEHRMTVRQLLEHALHDSSHHLDDVAKGLRRLGVDPDS